MMNHRCLVLLALPLCLLAADAPPKGKAQAQAPALTLTPVERQMILGFQGRAEAVQLRAQMQLDAIAREQDEYLRGVAARLGLKPEALAQEYTVDLKSGAVTPKAKEAKP